VLLSAKFAAENSVRVESVNNNFKKELQR